MKSKFKATPEATASGVFFLLAFAFIHDVSAASENSAA